MGFWDGLRTIAGKAINRSSSDISSDSNGVPYLTSLPEVARKLSDTVGAQKLIEYVPNSVHRDKIGRVLTGLGKFAVDSAVSDTVGAQKLIEYVPNSVHRDKIGRVLTGLGKFAVDSAVNESLKSVTGGIQVYKIVREGLKDQPPLQPTNGNQKTEHSLVMEDMQAKLEKLQEELNFIKQQNDASIQCDKEMDLTKETSTEPTEVSTPQKTDVKKVFIRSRL